MKATDIPAELSDALAGASRIAVLTGSGVSAESGVPTFREAQTGMWARYDPEQLATPEAFERNPRLVWEWYDWRRGLIAKAQPNPAHEALARLGQRKPATVVITQNVDGLHQRAGSPGVIELHGNLFRARCTGCGQRTLLAEEPHPEPPRCPGCGNLLRPDVVWFGEQLPEAAMEQAWDGATGAEWMLVIGTSSLVHPAAQLPAMAKRAGCRVVEINVYPTPLSPDADFVLSGPAGRVLPALLEHDNR